MPVADQAAPEFVAAAAELAGTIRDRTGNIGYITEAVGHNSQAIAEAAMTAHSVANKAEGLHTFTATFKT